jgi:hypothetical protein
MVGGRSSGTQGKLTTAWRTTSYDFNKLGHHGEDVVDQSFNSHTNVRSPPITACDHQRRESANSRCCQPSNVNRNNDLISTAACSWSTPPREGCPADRHRQAVATGSRCTVPSEVSTAAANTLGSFVG